MLKSAYKNMIEIDKFLDVFNALSDRTRLRIIRILLKAGTELCVCELMDSLAESQYNVSRHLKVLKNSGLVKNNEVGKWAFYSLKKSADKFNRYIKKAISEIPEDVFRLDEWRLKKRLSLRKKGKCVVGIGDSKWKKILKKLEDRRI